jgi:hypothetical protein
MLDRRTSRMSPQRCWRVLAVLLSVTPCRAHAGKGLEALLDSMIVGGKRKVREAMGPGEADAVCRAPQVRAWRLNTRGAQDGRGGGYRSGAGRRWRGCLVADAVWVGGALGSAGGRSSASLRGTRGERLSAPYVHTGTVGHSEAPVYPSQTLHHLSLYRRALLGTLPCFLRTVVAGRGGLPSFFNQFSKLWLRF